MNTSEIAHWELIKPSDKATGDKLGEYFNKNAEFNKSKLVTQVVNYSPVNLMVVSTDGLSVDLNCVSEVNCSQPELYRHGYGPCVVNCAISITPSTANYLFNPINTDAAQLGNLVAGQKEVVINSHYQHFGNNRSTHMYNQNKTVTGTSYHQTLMMSEAAILLMYGGLNIKSKDSLTQRELLKKVDLEWSHTITVCNNSKHDRDLHVGMLGMVYTVRPTVNPTTESYLVVGHKKPKLRIERRVITQNTLPELITANKKQAVFEALLSNHRQAIISEAAISSEMFLTEVTDELKQRIYDSEIELVDYIKRHEHNSKITELTNKIITTNKGIDNYLELVALTNDYYAVKATASEREADMAVVNGLGKVFL